MASTSAPDVVTGDGPLKHLTDVIADGKDDLARFSVTGSSTVVPVSCELAASIDSMTETEVKDDIEKSTHVMVAGVLRKLKQLTGVTWEKVEALLTNSYVAEPDTGNDVITSERYAKTGDKSKFLVGGKPSPTLLKDIKSWITRTVNDRKVLSEMNLDLIVLGRIVTAASLCIDWLANLTGETTYKERTVVDVGVLRFPDETNEYFQLYKIEIKGYIDVSREVWDMVDKNGLVLTYTSKRFIPRASIIGRLADDTQAKAEAESVTFYTSQPKVKKALTQRTASKWPVVYLANDVKVPSVMKVLSDAASALDAFDMKTKGSTPLVCDLAVAFDDLTASEIKQMGEYTLMTVYGVNKTLKKLTEVSYETLKSEMSNLSVLATIGSNVRSDQIDKTYEGGNFPGGSSHDDVKREIKLWFKKLINDSEVLEDLQNLIDMNALVKCLVTAGKHLDTLGKVKGEHEYNARGLVDLTVLRFPDNTREYFHLYKIELKAFTDCTREMIDEKDRCGLLGDFQDVKFGPRTTVLDEISKRTVDRVAGEALTFYGAKM